jgi:hypothetical protein
MEHFLHGCLFGGGEHFTFFSPIWNFADACISVGIFCHYSWPKKSCLKEQLKEGESAENEASVSETMDIRVIKYERQGNNISYWLAAVS